MQSRRGFLSAGRLVGYAIAVVIIGAIGIGGWMYVNNTASVPDPLAPPDAGALSQYLLAQHKEAASDPGGMTLKDPAKLSDQLANWFGSRRTVEPQPGSDEAALLVGPKSTVTFLGCRPSNVPGPGKSVQILFKTGPQGGPDQSASVFMKRYAGAPELQDKTSYTLAAKGGGPAIIVWRDGGVVFDLVSGNQQALDTLAKAMSTPAPSRTY
jgi:hypothetical protein